MNSEIKPALPQDLPRLWDVIQLLRPHLSYESYLEMATEMLSTGYQVAFVEVNGKPVSAIGYRHLQFLFNGKHIYVDDLSTLAEHRGKGYAGRLLDYVVEEAAGNGYNSVTLDSGFQRQVAHRLYLNKGFVISSFHFMKQIQ
ncbi:MAG TPA: GNAT family N-acetyltransferase [Flavitalea sp.]|nr:GNAT family N-acetyltransferase [Flavitalea sp.]